MLRPFRFARTHDSPGDGCESGAGWLSGKLVVHGGAPAANVDLHECGGATREQQRVIKLRLKRMGAKKRPSYRIVVAESTAARDGRFIESIGFYDPITEPATLRIDADRAKHWLSVGAQPSDTVRALLAKQGIGAGKAS